MLDPMKPLMEVLSDQMTNPQYSILVMPFTFGQFRIRLTDLLNPDAFAPPGHASIVQDMCTYKKQTAESVLEKLKTAEDPLKAARSYAKPWNCEYEGGRIRLDNEETPE